MSDVDLSDHVPTTAIGDGRERCEADGYLWPCPELRIRPRPLEQFDRELLEVVDPKVGAQVWKRIPEGADYDPVGGMVVGFFDEVDDETGELVRRLRVVDVWRGQPRWRVFRLDEVEPLTIGLPNAASIRGRIRALCAWVGKRRGAMTKEELDALADALELGKAIA